MQNNQIPKGNVDKQVSTAKDFGDQAAFDIVAQLTAPTEVDAPVVTAEEGGDVTPTVEAPAEEVAPEGTQEEPKTEDAKPEEKPNESEETETDKPFATIGGQNFATAEDLIKFTTSQIGYNRFITGNVRKAKPEWFDAEGKLIPSKMQKVEEIKENVDAAVEKVQQGITLSDTEKEQLRSVGIVFKEDLEAVKTEEGLKESLSVVDEFVSKHPLAEGYLSDLADIMEAEKAKPAHLQMDLENAWQFVKSKNDIEEAGDKPEEVKPIQKKQGLDSQVPSSPIRAAGAKPITSKRDFMDEVMGASGM